MPKKEAVQAVPMRVLKIATCSSLSGRSQLTYHVGCNAEGEIQLKVAANSSTGQFNADWIPLSMVEQLLSDYPKEKPLSSAVLRPLYRHKSSNSPSFAFGIFLAEGLVKKAGTEKDSGYQLGDIDAFKQAITALITSDTNLSTAIDPTDTPASAKSKRNAKGSA